MNKRQSVANEGRVCLTVADHGPSLVLTSGREWCPHQSHDGGGKRGIGGFRLKLGLGKKKGRAKPTTPFLDKQVIEDDTADRPQSA